MHMRTIPSSLMQRIVAAIAAPALAMFGFLLVMPTVQAQEIVYSETFNASGSASYNVTSAGSFTAIDGTVVDLLTPGSTWINLCPSSTGCVDMNGSGTASP